MRLILGNSYSASLALLSLLLALTPIARAQQNFIPIDVSVQPPSCARACVNELAGREFQPFVCGPLPTTECLCSKYANTGPSLGDLYSYCMTTYCNATSNIPISSIYKLCDNVSAAAQAETVASTQAPPITSALPSTTISVPLTTSTPLVDVAAVTSMMTQTPALLSTATSQQATSQSSSQAPQPTADGATVPAGYSVMTPGEIAAIAVGAVIGFVVIFIAISILVSTVLARRRQQQSGHHRTYRHPPGSRFASSLAFTSNNSLGPAYEKRAEEGLGLATSTQSLEKMAPIHNPPPTHAKQSSVVGNHTPASSSRYLSQLWPLPQAMETKLQPSQVFRPEQERTSNFTPRPCSPPAQAHSSHSAFTNTIPLSGTNAVDPSAPPRPILQPFRPGTSALRPHQAPAQPAQPIEQSARGKPVGLKLRIPENTRAVSPSQIPRADTIGLAISEEKDKRHSARYSGILQSPAPAAPPPPLPTGVRRTERADYMPSYYSKTRQQQLATPTSAMSSGNSPTLSPESATKPATSFTGPAGEGVKMSNVKMNTIKSNIRVRDSATSADTAFDSDASLTPLEDDDDADDSPVLPSPRASARKPPHPQSSQARYPPDLPLHLVPSHPPTPQHQNAEARLLLSMPSPAMPAPLFHHARHLPPAARSPRQEHTRSGSSLLQKRRGEAYERRLEKSLWITGSNGRSSPGQMSGTATGSGHGRRYGEARVPQQQDPLQSPTWEPKLTPRRVGPGGDMYLEVHM